MRAADDQTGSSDPADPAPLGGRAISGQRERTESRSIAGDVRTGTTDPGARRRRTGERFNAPPPPEPVLVEGIGNVIAFAGQPIGGQESLFNIGGAPIAVLGGVFSGGLPLGGPVTQIFRGGSAPTPNTLFLSTITPAGPIAGFLIGSGGGPIGAATFGGGGLPIEASAALQREEAALQPRTVAVGASITDVSAVTFGRPRGGG